ncbi:hypothetical protein ASE01_04755 [Nocardioides sp. Root190]|nr:hypothetical protein ASE01_04755 [Nocardioides sp. Root190]
MLDDMTRTDVLAYVETCHTTRLQAERDLLAAAHRWAVLHHPDRHQNLSLRARERAVPAGAPGTPPITEYAPSAFGARIQTSPYGAKRLIADAVDIHHRLPRLAEGLKAGTTRAGHARHVAEATRELSADEAAWVDAEVVESADGRLAWKRFEALVEGKVAAAAPELAKAKEKASALECGIRMRRVNKHGIGTLIIREHIASLLGSIGGIDAVARALEATMPGVGKAERQLAAFALLTNPDAHPDLHEHVDLDAGPVKPKVKFTLHLTPDSQIARMEGHGPVSIAWVKHLIEHIAGQVKVAPVINPANHAPVDAYEIPAAMREAVHVMHGGDVFPYAANTTRKVDLDHTIAYAQGGPTAVGNLAPMTRAHHRIKTHHTEEDRQGQRTGWELRQPFPGILVWRDPYGAHYLIDHSGTRQLTSNMTPSGGHELSPAEIYTTQFIVKYLAA